MTNVHKRLLIISPVFEVGAGYRYRIQQYLPMLAAHGIEPTIWPFYSDAFLQVVYQHGRYATKALQFLSQASRRLTQLSQLKAFDGVFVYREALPVGPPLWEWVCATRRRLPMIFDFDDAVFLGDTSEVNGFLHGWKCPWKANHIMRWSRHVITGNVYLASYAQRHQPNVTVVPTSIDTTQYQARVYPPVESAVPVIGWIGSPTTVKYLESLAPAFTRLAQQYRFRLKIIGAGHAVRMAGVEIEQHAWKLDGEIDAFRSCDIGVAPLWDDAWSRGKCGFKALQFMACAVPVVASTVGVHSEIIQSGVNGILASSLEEWFGALKLLLEDIALRRRLGQAGRETVKQRYSVAVNAPIFLAAVKTLWESAALSRLTSEANGTTSLDKTCAVSAVS